MTNRASDANKNWGGDTIIKNWGAKTPFDTFFSQNLWQTKYKFNDEQKIGGPKASRASEALINYQHCLYASHINAKIGYMYAYILKILN